MSGARKVSNITINTSKRGSGLRLAKEMRHPNIAFVGSLNVEFHSYTNVVPRVSESVIGSRLQIGYGGKGGNACIMCAKLGGSTIMISKVGGDCFGREYVSRLRKLRINTSQITITDQATTGVGLYTVDSNGKYYGLVIPNANYLLLPSEVSNAKNLLKHVKIGVFSLEIPAETVLESMKLFKEHGVETLILQVNNALDDIFFELATIIVLNKAELETATGDDVKSIGDADSALRKLILKGCDIAIATLGGWGALILEKTNPTKSTRVMVRPVDEPVDVTGAGEAFIGTLAYILVNYKDLTIDQMVKIACEVARETVVKYGSQDSFPFKSDVRHLFPEAMERKE